MFLSRELPYGFKIHVIILAKEASSKFTQIFDSFTTIDVILYKINTLCNTTQAMPYFVVP